MIYVILAMSILFTLIGFTVNRQNAKYLLSGYNTMPEAARSKINLDDYIPYFRKFHLFLGVSFLFLGFTITYLLGEIAGGVFLAVYPILGYIYFIITGTKRISGNFNNSHKLLVIILASTLFLIVFSLALGFRDNEIQIEQNQIEISGQYGETIAFDHIRYIEIVQQLPPIKSKVHGFALGHIKKGYFRTAEGQKVKLIINSTNDPILCITTRDGNLIYYAGQSKSNPDLLNELKGMVPQLYQP